MDEDEPMYTVQAAANALNVNPETIRRRVHRGEIPAYDIGGRIRIKASDIDAYMEANRIQTKETR